MGSHNQLALIQIHKAKFQPPFLEVGAKAYGDVDRVRTMFQAENDFVGTDMLDGENVDVVLDLTNPFSEVDKVLEGRRFKSIFCLSVLEHCDNPFKMATNLTELLDTDGVLYISVPHSRKFHGYPSDYWRFTHEGVKKLFPELTFSNEEMWISTDVEHDIRSLEDSDLGRVRFKGSYFRQQGHHLSALFADLARLMMTPFSKKLTKHRYYTPPVMIDMIGRREAELSRKIG